MTNDNAPTIIQRTLVSIEDRMDFLPSLFGFNLMLVGEGLVYDWMKRLSPDYQGGYWNFFILDNGAYYMAPKHEGKMLIQVYGNQFEGEVSADAAGIIATMFALGHLAAEFREERLIDLYHLLRHYIEEHPESGAIYQALD